MLWLGLLLFLIMLYRACSCGATSYRVVTMLQWLKLAYLADFQSCTCDFPVLYIFLEY